MPGWAQIPHYWYWLGPGNTNVAAGCYTGYWEGVVPGIPPSQYPARGADQHGRRPARCTTTTAGTSGTCTYDRFGPSVGDPRWNTHSIPWGDGLQLPHGSIPPPSSTARRLLIDPAAGPCTCGPYPNCGLINYIFIYNPALGAVQGHVPR